MTAPAAKPKRKGTPRPNAGRPTKYEPRYCEMVVEHMKEGASLTSFAASIDVARDTITEWTKAHPEFSAAATRGKAACAAWWEARGRDIARGGGGPGASTLVIFGLKNMGADDWCETSHVDLTSGGQPLGLGEFYGNPAAQGEDED